MFITEIDNKKDSRIGTGGIKILGYVMVSHKAPKLYRYA
jgi:hypothetical protein